MSDRLTELRNRLRYVAETHGLAGWSDAKQAADAIDALTAERDKLRAALQKISSTWEDESTDWPGGSEEEAASYAGIARAALQRKGR